MSIPARVAPDVPSSAAEPVEPGSPALDAAELVLGDAWPTAPGDGTAARIYLALIQQPRPSRSALRAEGFTSAEVDRSLLLLADRGLISLQDAEVVDVPSPDLTLPTYAAALERHALTSRSAIRGLTQLYRMARAESPRTLSTMGIRLLRSAREVDQGRWEVVGLARSTFLEFCALGPADGPAIMARATVLAEAAGPGGPLADVPDRRVVVDSTVLEVDGALDAFGRLVELGVEVRVAPRVPGSGVISDQAAFVDLGHLDPTGPGSMLVRHHPLVEVIRIVAECLHETGTSLTRPGSAEPAQPWLDERDRQILTLIAAGATDTMIARQVRISQRTVERRLRVIMDGLGATTRFQAGVQAAKRGLV